MILINIKYLLLNILNIHGQVFWEKETSEDRNLKFKGP